MMYENDQKTIKQKCETNHKDKNVTFLQEKKKNYDFLQDINNILFRCSF